MATQEARPASGLVLVILGVWLVAQAIGGNLAGRLREASFVGSVPKGSAITTATGVTADAAAALQEFIGDRVRAGATVPQAIAEANQLGFTLSEGFGNG